MKPKHYIIRVETTKSKRETKIQANTFEILKALLEGIYQQELGHRWKKLKVSILDSKTKTTILEKKKG